MKNSILRVLGLAFGLALLVQPITAYAYSDENGEDGPAQLITAEDVVIPASAINEVAEIVSGAVASEDNAASESAVASTPATGATLTPDGTGTVVDSVTDEDGKLFYTVTTEAGNVFYLVIDTQRGTENVYFLNAVTESDLLALAEPATGESAVPGGTGSTEPEQPAPVDEPDGDTTAEEEPPAEETTGGGISKIVLVVLIVAVGGGAAYYFKILRPKQQAAGDDEYMSEYEGEDTPDPYAGSDPFAEDEAPAPYDEDMEIYDSGLDDVDDAPPWDVDEGEEE